MGSPSFRPFITPRWTIADPPPIAVSILSTDDCVISGYTVTQRRTERRAKEALTVREAAERVATCFAYWVQTTEERPSWSREWWNLLMTMAELRDALGMEKT